MLVGTEPGLCVATLVAPAHGELRRRFETLARPWGWYITVFARK